MEYCTRKGYKNCQNEHWLLCWIEAMIRVASVRSCQISRFLFHLTKKLSNLSASVSSSDVFLLAPLAFGLFPLPRRSAQFDYYF